MNEQKQNQPTKQPNDQPAPQQKPIANKQDPALFLALFFILFSLLLICILICSVISTVTRADRPDISDSQQTTSDPSNGDGPSVTDLPVFSGGSIGTMPHTTEKTVILGNELHSSYGVLVDVSSGVILAEKGSDTRFNPASMTKVMTLIVACENLKESDLDREVVMTADLYNYVRTGAYADAGVLGYQIGDKIKIRDLLYGIGIESDADCTMMVVNALFEEDSPAEAERKFVALMAETTASMELKNTHFDNVIGHESDNNYSTAADIAAIMMYALDSPLIKDILSTSSRLHYIYRLEDDGITYERWRMTYYSSLFNNKREGETSRIYAYEQKYAAFSLASAQFLGGKTGTLGSGSTTDPWNYSLVSFARQNGKLYIAVTGELTATGYNVMKDAKTLYDNYIQ